MIIKPEISIIIPCYNSSITLKKCLKSIFSNKNIRFEIIVVDDCSNDNPAKITEAYPIKLVQHKKNKGAAAARNTGAKYAKSEILLFIDSDLIIEKDTISNILKIFKKENFDVISGIWSSKTFDSSIGKKYQSIRTFYNYNKPFNKNQYFRKYKCISSSLVAFKTQVFRKIGGFSESFTGAGGEEYEMGERLIKFGYTNYLCKKVIGHHHYPPLHKRYIELFKRSQVYIRFILNTKSLDSPGSNASSGEAISSILSLIILCSIVLIQFIGRLIFIPIAFLICLNFGFYWYSTRKQDPIKSLSFIFLDFLWYLSIAFGSIVGLARHTVSFFDKFKFLFTKTPPHVLLFVTGRCNAKCKHCFYYKNIKNANKNQELQLKEYKKISASLNHVKYLSITGGEPMLRDDLYGIINTFYVTNKTEFLSLHTNGSFPIKTKELVKKLSVNCPDLKIRVCTSLDGPKIFHDWIRSKPNLFEDTIKTIKEIKKLQQIFSNIEIVVTSVYSNLNKDQIPTLNKYIRSSLKIDHHVSLIRGDVKNPFIKKINLEDYKTLSQYINKKNSNKNQGIISSIQKAMDSLTLRIVYYVYNQNKNILPCKAGNKSIVIDEKGLLYPCELKKSLGQLKDFDFMVPKILNLKKKDIKKLSNCYCTWECIIPVNIVFNIRTYPWLFLEWIKIQIQTRFN